MKRAKRLIAEAKEKKLTSLDLGNCGLTDLEKEVPELFELKHLKELSLYDNQITDISGLTNLQNLRTLNLFRTKITDISALANLQNLHTLSLSNNIKITDISVLGNLQNLYTLNLSNTKITNISALGNLQNLHTLNLSMTFISDIHPLLHLLKRKKNTLKCVTNKQWQETNGGKINLAYCPLTQPPMEIVEQGNEAIIRYFEEIDRVGLSQVREAKLILAGSGESGKTSLRIRLNDKNAPLPKKDERTHNVEVDIYPFLTTYGNIFQAHVWDFGGQQIIHHFHRFFMNEDALYILMTETSRENDNFDYWLQNIQLFGKNSPILFVQNKKNGIPRSLNIANYKQHFSIQEDLIEVNLLTNEGLPALERAIQYHLQKLPITQRTIPTSWFEIRKALEKECLQTAILPYEKFVQLCKQQGITERVKIEDVGTFLHTLGIILWYKENETLHGKIILQREWATEGIFELIFNEEIQKTARFDKKMAQNVWDNCGKNTNYAYHCHELVAMMCEFRLCYPQRNKRNAYIIPALLPAKPSEVEWLYEQRIRIVYKYKHIPQGIANYIAAEMHDKIIDDAHVWSEGFYIHTENAQAKITEYKYTNQLEIIIAGEEHQTLFGEIKNIIEKMHRDYAGIEPTLEIPCICDACKKLPLAKRESYRYVDVIKRKNKGVKSTIECRASGIDVPLKALLDNLLPNKLQEKNEEHEDEKIEKLVGNDNLEEAISQLVQYLKDKPEYHEVIILQARLKQCKSAYLVNTIDEKEYNITLNQIRIAVLRLINASN